MRKTIQIALLLFITLPSWAQRESTLTPRPELLRDAIRACDKLKDAIEGVVSALR